MVEFKLSVVFFALTLFEIYTYLWYADSVLQKWKYVLTYVKIKQQFKLR